MDAKTQNSVTCRRCRKDKGVGRCENGEVCPCPVDGAPLDDHAATGDCPEKRLTRPDDPVTLTVKGSFVKREPTRLEKVKRTWRDAMAFAKSMASRAVEGKVSPAIRATRILSCHGNGADVAPCPARAFYAQGGFHYCNDCGCGARELARLSAPGSSPDKPTFDPDAYDKLDYPYLECPRGRPGFSNADK